MDFWREAPGVFVVPFILCPKVELWNRVVGMRVKGFLEIVERKERDTAARFAASLLGFARFFRFPVLGMVNGVFVKVLERLLYKINLLEQI